MKSKLSDYPPNFLPLAHNHAHCIARALNHAHEQCTRNHVRFTAIRQRVLELIWQSHRPLGAYGILEALIGEGRSCAPPTVYRALEFLLEQGLVHRIASLNAFIGCMQPGHDGKGHFFICRHCANATEFNDARVEQTINHAADAAGFKAESQSIEVTGVCPNCAE